MHCVCGLCVCNAHQHVAAGVQQTMWLLGVLGDTADDAGASLWCSEVRIMVHHIELSLCMVSRA